MMQWESFATFLSMLVFLPKDHFYFPKRSNSFFGASSEVFQTSKTIQHTYFQRHLAEVKYCITFHFYNCLLLAWARSIFISWTVEQSCSFFQRLWTSYTLDSPFPPSLSACSLLNKVVRECSIPLKSSIDSTWLFIILFNSTVKQLYSALPRFYKYWRRFQGVSLPGRAPCWGMIRRIWQTWRSKSGHYIEPSDAAKKWRTRLPSFGWRTATWRRACGIVRSRPSWRVPRTWHC